MDHNFGINQAFVEELYLRYQENRSSVGEAWKGLFDRLDGAVLGAPATPPPSLAATPGPAAERELFAMAAVQRVYQLINLYRLRGHLWAELDPLGLVAKPEREIAITHVGLTERDLDVVFPTGDLAGPPFATLREIVQRLEDTYCRTIGAEFMHVEDPATRAWLQQRMESTRNHLALSGPEQLQILTKLVDAEIFEQFLHTNFLGAKRFSLEGAEALIPLVDLVVERCGTHGVEELVIGMAHRGRLNVLVNILQKNVREIFAHFEDRHPEHHLGRGDVKYHLGYSTDRVTRAGQNVHLSLAFNPSHLEFVNPVVEGRVRAKQDRRGDSARKRGVPLLIHGDAAFIGQGVVAETLNLMLLPGYTTGGTLHLVVNNQIGFTTSPSDARSTRYATDLALMLGIPVFHVNGEDPEAVAQVAALAVDFRQTFGRDVVIDMYCYRRWGHNEGDEPRYTQPFMYAAIDRKASVRAAYVQRLVAMGQLSEAQADALVSSRRSHLEQALHETRRDPTYTAPSALAGLWSHYKGGADVGIPEVPTGVPVDTLRELLTRLTTVPPGLHVHPKLEGLLKNHREKITGQRPLDWWAGEALAFATLLLDGAPVRLSGQDSRRGTFGHRHATWIDHTTGHAYTPLQHLSPTQARFEAWDSPLSETGVLGFDYGYSLDYPEGLTLWEGQFGDFANSAQVIIDQFISSSEDKWNRLSGIVLLLPHGFEGAGPEHSSARLERFLQLCAEDNLIVVNLTTPAQLFHALRRQVLRPYRKPLIVMTPKSHLRSREATSTLEALATGAYQKLLPDAGNTDPAAVRRILLCSGKVYFELAAARAARNAHDVAIVRLEQLYPLDAPSLDATLAPYRAGTPLYWVQEEPWNMGAWYYLQARLPRLLGARHPVTCVSREESASPATGSAASHKMEQEKLLERAFGDLD